MKTTPRKTPSVRRPGRPMEKPVLDRYGRLTLLKRAPTVKELSTFRCDCGKVIKRPLDYVRTGDTRSCGCLRRENSSEMSKRVNTIHGESRGKHRPGTSPEWRAWENMIGRCHRPSNSDYGRWGAKGVTVCSRWRDSFKAFLADVGRKPSPSHTIDRFPDCNGNYEPGNVRWATMKEQANNRGNTIRITFEGRSRTISQWADEYGVDRVLLYRRLHRGMNLRQALEEMRVQS